MVKGARITKEDRAQLRRTQIMQAGQRIFAEKGYHETSIADIATELNIGHGTFYRYFKNKRDIFVSIMEMILQQVTAVVMGEDPSGSDTLDEYREQVWNIGDKLLTLFVDDETISNLLYYESMGLDIELREKIQGMLDVFGRFTEMYLINGKDKGFLRKDLDTHVTALSINAIIFQGARRLSHSTEKETDKKRWLTAVRSMMFDGIKK